MEKIQTVLLGSLPFPEKSASLLRAAILHEQNIAGDFSFFGFTSVSSTMDIAAAYSNGTLPNVDLEPYRVAGHGENFVFLALAQTKGRGRKQRTWVSSDGQGIYVTYVFFVEDGVPLNGFSLLLGLAVWNFVHRSGGEAMLKWPNDVLGKGPRDERQRKLAGILVEVGASAHKARMRAVLAGIGLNLDAQSFPDEVPGISLEEILERKESYEGAFVSLTTEIASYSKRFFADGFRLFATEWTEHSGQRGTEVSIQGADGAIKKGIVAGVADDGALRLQETDGMISLVYSGEVL